MDAGRLRNFVTVQQKSLAGSGDRGQPVYSWTTFAQIYAEIEPLPTAGKKMEIARQLVATATHQVTIRYLAGLTPEMRIVDLNGVVYQIGYVAYGQDDQRYFMQSLLCTVQMSGI